jgi:hypothetical protein
MQKEVFTMVSHSFSRTVGGKQICQSCGLVGLNNPLTEWCINKGCMYDIHPQYKSTVKKLTRGFK